jgi:hypothetical protein
MSTDVAFTTSENGVFLRVYLFCVHYCHHCNYDCSCSTTVIILFISSHFSLDCLRQIDMCPRYCRHPYSHLEIHPDKFLPHLSHQWRFNIQHSRPTTTTKYNHDCCSQISYVTMKSWRSYNSLVS